MRERNVEIARSVVAAYNRGDMEGVLAVVSPDVEVVSTPEMPKDGRFEGHEGFMTWLTQWLEAWDEFRLVVGDVEAIDDRHVLADVRQVARGAHSGIEIDMGVVHLFEMAPDGTIVRFQLHTSREAALAAV